MPRLAKPRLAPGEYSPEVISRFWAKVRLGDAGVCWTWQAGQSPKGYGRFGINHGARFAHRVAWEIANGTPIPDGLIVMHACDNPPCCNPAHLRVGTIAENNADRDSKGHYVGAKGTRHGRAKLTEEDVQHIRESPLSSLKLAPLIGVSSTTIRTIRRGDGWRHVAKQPPASRQLDRTGDPRLGYSAWLA